MYNQPQSNLVLVILFSIALILSLVITAINPIYIGIGLTAIFILAFAVRNLQIGVYLIAITYPFIALQLYFGKDINVPVVDLIALIFCGAWLLRIVWLYISRQKKITFRDYPGIGFFLLFILVTLLSITNAPDKLQSFKYVLRPLFFFYLMFVLMPYNVINSKEILKKTLWVLFFVGLFISGMGVIALITRAYIGFPRAIPLCIANICPLGTNHNLIAEALVALVPFCGVLVIWEKNAKIKKLLIIAALVMTGVLLATFSRAGWICLALEVLVFVIIRFRGKLKTFLRYGLIALLIFSPLIFMMWQMIVQGITDPSDRNRMFLTEIAMDGFKMHPVIGCGAGTFMQMVSQNKLYMLQFGNPIESHGIVQKLLAETGILGFITFSLLVGYILYILIRAYGRVKLNPFWRDIMLLFIIAVVGSLVFQLFNTSYFVSKMWFPIGIALAASKLALSGEKK